MKRVFVIHGWDGHVDEVWFPWLKRELENEDFEVSVLQMPEPASPNITTWVANLAQAVGVADNRTYFVGHSIGCQTILRYLETLPVETKVGGAVFVAGFFTLTNIDEPDEVAIAKPWLETPIDYAKVKSHTANFTAIFSDNDEFVPLENEALYKQRLAAKTIIEHGLNHFNEKQNPDYKQMPVVLRAVLDVAA